MENSTAFANCDGGKLYIGIRDDGTAVGLDNPDGVSLQISNMVRDAIKPDVTMFLYYKTIKEDGKKEYWNMPGFMELLQEMT